MERARKPTPHRAKRQKQGESPGDSIRAPSSQEEGVARLLKRMRSGDRAAAATFVTKYESRIRRRVRGKLGSEMRSIFDSQDILSTLGRRLDEIVRSGRLKASCEAELWSLAFHTAELAVQEKARALRRTRSRERVAAETARGESIPRHDSRTESDAPALEIALQHLEDATDRQILLLWTAGQRPKAIAAAVRLSPDAVRKRWQRITRHLRTRLGPDILR